MTAEHEELAAWLDEHNSYHHSKAASTIRQLSRDLEEARGERDAATRMFAAAVHAAGGTLLIPGRSMVAVESDMRLERRDKVAAGGAVFALSPQTEADKGGTCPQCGEPWNDHKPKQYAECMGDPLAPERKP